MQHPQAPIASILVVVPLAEERDYIHQVVNGRDGWRVTTPQRRFRCELHIPDGWVQVAFQTLDNMGHVSGVVGTIEGIAVTKPHLVLLVGLAGSMKPDVVGLGDVVVSNRAKFYSCDKVGDLGSNDPSSRYILDNISDRPSDKLIVDHRDRYLANSFMRFERRVVESHGADDIVSTSERSIDRSRLSQLDRAHVPNKFQPLQSHARGREVHFGWILGSNHVVDSREYRDYLTEKNIDLTKDLHYQTREQNRSNWKKGDLLAVDMESFGVLEAVQWAAETAAPQGGCTNIIGGIVIRGVSDLAEDKGPTDAGARQQLRDLAVRNACEVALQILEQIDYSKFISTDGGG